METDKSSRYNQFNALNMGARIVRVTCLLPLFMLVGCASSYDYYPCGKVSCTYCPLQPLPYSLFESGNCSDSIGQVYLANLANENYVETLPDSEANPDDDESESERQEKSDEGEKDDNPK